MTSANKLNALKSKLSQNPSLNLCDDYEKLLLSFAAEKLKNPLDNFTLLSIKNLAAGSFSKALSLSGKALKMEQGFLPALRVKIEILAQQRKFGELEKLAKKNISCLFTMKPF
ncbi:MAG: hypothetical protein L6420_00710 [Elusimicrobia bacterium]|nr:hypothetical protein [Elusimicrobiota bacterium]